MLVLGVTALALHLKVDNAPELVLQGQIVLPSADWRQFFVWLPCLLLLPRSRADDMVEDLAVLLALLQRDELWNAFYYRLL